MRYIQLDKEEAQIAADFNEDKFEQVEKDKHEVYRVIASNTISKTKNINIRLSVRDIQKLKARAIETGLAYQTLAAAILRQYAARKIEGKL